MCALDDNIWIWMALDQMSQHVLKQLRTMTTDVENSYRIVPFLQLSSFISLLRHR